MSTDDSAIVDHEPLVVHVDIAVLPDCADHFLIATDANATASRDEPGVLRFDVLVDRADPTHVVLVEVYRDTAAVAAHKQTAHYATWRDAVAPMMARPRSSVTLRLVSGASLDSAVDPPSSNPAIDLGNGR